MTKIAQGRARRGSQLWLQRAVADEWGSLQDPILAAIPGASRITWASPLAPDFAEYRDAAFLTQLGQSHLIEALAKFWPRGGPQWDALGSTDNRALLLVEAKSHVGEMCSSPTAATGEARFRIGQQLDRIAASLGARAGHAPWTNQFYQLANRIAHLDFLRSHGLDARLVLVNFLNDRQMHGPSTKETWRAAYEVAFHVMGLSKRHRLSRYILEVFPDVSVAAARYIEEEEDLERLRRPS